MHERRHVCSMSSSQPAGNKALGAVRKEWDKEAFAQRARERVERELEEERQKALAKAPPRVVVQRAPLDRDKARANQNMDLHGAVGQKKVINTKQPELGRSPFFCTVCNCELRDSANWLAHLNGKNHVRNLGMNMRAERSTVEGVRAKLAQTSRKRDEALTPDEAARRFRVDFDEQLRCREEEARLEKQRKKQAEKERRNATRVEAGPESVEGQEAPEVDPMMAAMGFDFSSFSSTKKR